MRWEKVKGLGGDGPGKRWGHTCNTIRDGRLLYLFGGYGKNNCLTNQVHVFDTFRQSWSEPAVKGSPPIPRDSHSCSVVGDGLFVFGGTDGTRQLNDLHILDISSHTWIVPTVRGEAPPAREGHGAAVIGKRLFVFGGCGTSADNNDVFYNDLYILNTETYVWMCATTSGTPPSPRDSHTCSSWRNKLIVVAGEDEHDYYLSDVHVLDTDTLTWSKLRTFGQLLPPRAGHCTVSLGQTLFVFGGFSESQSLYNDLYMLDIETGACSKVVTTTNGPCARFAVAGDCLDPYMNGVLVFLGGCNRNLEALDDMYYLYTGIAWERENRPEKLSLRKQLKLKCQGQNLSLVQNPVLCGYEVGADSKHPMTILNYNQPSKVDIPGRKPVPLGKRTFVAKVTEKSSTGYTIETVIDGKPLHGILFSNKPNILSPVSNTSSRKRTAGDVGTLASNGIHIHSSNVTTSTVLGQDKMEYQQELWGGSSEFVGRRKEADNTNVVSSIPTTAAESFKVSVNPEPEAVSLNQNADEKNDTPKSLIDSLKHDGSNDVTSSKGEIQIGDQINAPVSNYEIPRQASDAPNSNATFLKPAAAESSVSLPNQGETVDCTTPMTEGHS
ncbi:unnamed protein product [Sphenostylis stenocarpa]|uniref:Uncharacterized protein n=1 Tax=Sphenostylis stenocarpa TaxID=92480 RepID=A0AA86SYU0_9FABA|nr:unnamed protein product [Sphenostylis stenocarpa]